MPSCTVCGENEFEARDGLFFCSMCMTQSQDLRQEEAGETFMDMTNPGFKHLIRNKEHQRGKRTMKRDKGRPWSCYEGFQIILKEQVKALIRLGADPKLKDIVFRLWCTYLAKINVAFTEDLEKINPLLKKFERHREKYPGTTENPDIKPVVLHRMWKKKMTRSVVDATANIENQDLQFSLRDEDFYDEDNPFKCVNEKLDSDDEFDTDSNDSFDLEEKDQISSGMSRRSYTQHPGFMNMKKTLVFCLLGLMYTNSITTAVDIVRWVHENEIPYEKASHLLPTDMKFGPYDTNTFHATLPVSEETLRKDCGQMIKYLDLRDAPMTPITDLINKYLVVLELPGDLHGFVHKIQRLIEYEKRYKYVSLPSYDSLAMAFIITTLEILIGLDGSTERKLSKISKKMESLISEVHLFVWDDWVCHTNRKQKLTLNCLMSKTFDMRLMDNVEQVTASFRHTRRRVGRHTDKQLSKKFQETSQNALLLPLKMLSEKEQSTISTDNSRSQEDNDIVGLAAHETTNQMSEVRSHDIQSYRTCRLKHITQPKHFIELLNEEKRLSHERKCQNNMRGRVVNDSIENRILSDAAENRAKSDTTEERIISDSTEHRVESDSTEHRVESDSTEHRVESDSTEHRVESDSTEHRVESDSTEHRVVNDSREERTVFDTIENSVISDSIQNRVVNNNREDTAVNFNTEDTAITNDTREDMAVSCNSENKTESHTREDPCEITVKDQEMYDSLTEKLTQILMERKLDKNFGRKCVQTSDYSYRWLVHKCAVLIETSDTDLNRHVNQIQSALLKFFLHSTRLYFSEEFVEFLYNLIQKSKLYNNG